ncbi:hypothetical protein [Enterococcus casseliflavus]|uniref:hypothetical protein n=1 Tax=Enterococcus casseliflavus TaxID=37734 RepID=UPI0022E4A41F|nr:hypothetical protein [Enterococcus casseliflavus]
MKECDIDKLTTDAASLASAIAAIQRLSTNQLSTENRVDTLNELFGLIAAVRYLAEKHAEDVEEFELRLLLESKKEPTSSANEVSQ